VNRKFSSRNGKIMPYYYGFLFAIIANTAFWMFIYGIIKKYYSKSTRFKEMKVSLQYVLSQLDYWEK
jgi:hypothetical protein